jgi:DNA-directed RNA polymerase subunit E'/Rpb7
MNENLIKVLFKLVKMKYEKTCNEDDGIILCVHTLKDIQNVISKDAREIYFTVTMEAKVVKPEKNDKICFKPTLIIEKGVFGKIHDMISLFIPCDNLKEWSFDKENVCFTRGDKKIDKNDDIEVLIDDIKFNGTRYNCLCKVIK